MSPLFPYLDPCVGGILDSGQKIVVRVVESHRECTVDNPAVDVDAKVDLHNVPLLQHDILLTWIRGVVCDFVVEAEAGGKTHAGLEAVPGLDASMTKQCPDTVLNPVGDRKESLTGLGGLLYPFSSLAVHLGGLAVVLEEDFVLGVQKSVVTCFSHRCRCLGVDLHLTLGVLARGEELAQQDSWWG